LSKIKSGLFEKNESNENIVSVIEDIVQSVSQFVDSKGLRIIFDTNTEEKIIACDPHKIERIILNLVSNAIKFSNIGEEIIVRVTDEGAYVEIAVIDKGIGIDKKYLSTIFNRFNQVDKSFTRNAEGTGIGLNLVKSIVELHGGKIFVESKLGEGSKFKIKLPSRTIEESKNINKSRDHNNKIEMINIEFSDIYSI
jgi:signal transduction histidine kinase